MRRGLWIPILVVAIASSGCGRRSGADSAPKPQFAAQDAPGSAAAVMANTASRFGIPLYPNAVADTTHFSMADNVSQTNPRAYLTYVTADSLDQVVEFYRSRLSMDVADYQGAKQLKGATPTGAQVTINVGRDNSSGQTRFVVMAFLAQTGGGTMSTVSAPATPRAAPVPSRQNAAAETYAQGSEPSVWSFDTSAMPGSEPQPEDSAIPDPQDPPSEEPGYVEPSPEPEPEPMQDEAGDEVSPGDQGPPGDTF